MKYLLVAISIYMLCCSACKPIKPKNKYMQETTGKKYINYDSGYADINGINMYYELHGNNAEVLVLIHGGGSTIGTTFGKVLPMLANDFRVVAVELQAHGHTGDRPGPESFEQDADDVAALLQYLNIPKASFLGFSNGGNTAMQIALRHPAIVKNLVLASAFYKRDGMLPGFFEGMKNVTLKDMPQSLQNAFLAINPDQEKLLTMFTKDRDRMVNFKDWPDEALQSIEAPALIINGDRDVVTNAHAVLMSQMIRNARLMILPATHGSYIGEIETPNDTTGLIMLTVEIIKQFLKENDRK